MALYGKTGAANTANIWPGITEATAREFVRVGRGQPIAAPNVFAQLHVRYYHQQAYNTSGLTQMTFFNVAQAEHVSNLNNGLAPDERPFWCTGICVTAQDLNASGAVNGAASSSTATTAMDRVEQWRGILAAGLLQFYVADRLIHEGQDLTKYPSGGGICVDGAATGLTSGALANWTNGVAHAGNLFKFPRPYPVLPGKAVRVLLKWQTALAISTNAGRMRVDLIGESVAPLNQ